jgi:DNA polymerase-1
MEQPRLFLIDAYAMIYRSYYAFMRNPMRNSAGLNTSTIFAFLQSLDEIIRKEKPTHLAIVFDPGGKTFRHEMYSEYKANRQATPEEIKISVPYIHRLADALNISTAVLPNFEADDLIGTISREAAEAGMNVFMVSPDKDLCQLVNNNVFLYRPGKGKGNDTEILGIEQVKAKYGIDSPSRVIDLLALWGDSSDNVPGAPGVGEKTAVKLLAEFGSLEAILDGTSSLKGKIKESLEQNREKVLLSKKLVTIDTHAPFDFIPENFKYKEPNHEKIIELLTELEFSSLIKRYTSSSDVVKTTSKNVTLQQQPSLFDIPSSEGNFGGIQESSPFANAATTPHKYWLVADDETQSFLLEKLKTCDRFCFDTESTGLDSFKDELVGLSFSFDAHEAFYVPIKESFNEACEQLSVYARFFEDESKTIIGQNLKFDMLFLSRYGIEVKGKLFDTMIAHYILQPELSHKMDNLSRSYLNYSPIPIEELIGNKGPAQKTMRQIQVDKVKEYAAEDADITFQLSMVLANELEENGQTKLFFDLEMPMVRVLTDMEKEGFHLNVNFLNDYAIELKQDLQLIEKNIYELSGYEFNIASPKQLGEILFDRLKIAGDSKAKRTKTKAYSTSEETLQELTDKHPIIPLILEYRGVSKLLNTYVEALPKLINASTGNIHSSFNQTVTATGRLSSSNPNLQNIPIRDERGRKIRKAFISTWNDGKILSADYSQIELRVMAHMSNDESMIEAFHHNLDIHSATASKIFGVSVDDVSREQRRRAKTANFGIIYGISTFGLSQRLNIPRKEAGELIEGYFKNFPRVKEYMEESIKIARQKGYAETLLNRRRYLPELNSANANVRSNAERTAINTPIQGSAADVIKLAMIKIHQRIKDEGLTSKMILQVHDELIFDVRPEEESQLKQLVEEEMVSAIQLRVPLEVDAGCGPNWFDAH